MIQKPLGATGVDISAIGFGTGDYFWDSPLDDAEKVRLLQVGMDHGITWLDTAEGYGDGISEGIVSRAVKRVRDKVVLATKLATNHHYSSEVLSAAEGSLKRLDTDYIDLYQVHWPNPSVPVAETMESLRKLIDAGKIRYVGLCNFTRAGLVEAQEALGEHRIVSLQNEYNLFERTIEYSGLLDYCSENSITPLAYSALDQGRLTSMSTEKLDLVDKMAADHGRTPAQIVLRWLVSKDRMAAIVRSTQERHIIDNATATDFDLSDEEIRIIDQAFTEEMIHAPTDRISVSVEGEGGRQVYQTLEEALENRLDVSPSPMELSREMKQGELLKPVRLIPATKQGYDYDLIGGRIRYWAWVIAHEGKTPIPAYVRREIA